MKHCPNCDRENMDNAFYCIYCGASIEPSSEPHMRSAVDHLRFAVDVASSNLKVFVPMLGLLLYMIVTVAVMILGLGLNFEDPSPDLELFSTGNLALIASLFISMMLAGVLSIPFMQRLYYYAAVGEKVSLIRCFRYALRRFPVYLGSLLGVMILYSVVTIIFGCVGTYIPAFICTFLILTVPFGVVFYVSLGIMAWDDVGLVTAYKSSISFIRSKFMILIVLWVIIALVGIVLAIIPFGVLLDFGLNTILDIAVLDVYFCFKQELGEF